MKTNYFSDQIRSRIFADNSGAKRSGKVITDIKCPRCGRKEAYMWFSNPTHIICRRDKKCGANTPIASLYPDIEVDFREKYGSEGTVAVEAYLQSRGLDTSRFEFNQFELDREGKKFLVATFKLSNGEFYTGRLIGKTDGNKSWFKKDSQISKLIYKPGKLKKKAPIYMCEGPIDALSLDQSGFPAIALLSSSFTYSKNPTLKKLIKKGHSFVITMDNDKAGKKAIRKLVKMLKKKKAKFKVALPPEGKDWNDLLQLGRLNKKEMDICLWRGQLLQAEINNDLIMYVDILHEKYPYQRLFEFKGAYFYFIDEKSGSKKLSDFTARIPYTAVDRSIKDSPTMKHILITTSDREKTNRMMLSGTDIAKNESFRSAVSNGARQFWFGKQDDLNNLIQHLMRFNPPKIEAVNYFGYDKKTDNYIFPNALYDKNGIRYQPNDDGYFPRQNLAPMQGKSLEFGKPMPKRFISRLEKAFGPKGLIAFGYYIATLFSHVIFKEYDCFPFLMITGEPATGKTTFSRLMGKCFFVEGTDIPSGKSSTPKGIEREVSQKRSLVITITETRPGEETIDPKKILSIYNRGILQVRAKKTNDAQTFKLEFHAGLAFVQNLPIYQEGAAKQRFISIIFKNDDISDESHKAMEKLTSVADPAIGDIILKHRKTFEEKLISEINRCQKDLLVKEGFKSTRITLNHAMVYASLKVFCETFDIEFKNRAKKAYKYLLSLMKEKMLNKNTTSDIAESFFSSFTDLTYETDDKSRDNILEENKHYIIEKDTIFIRLPAVIAAMIKAGRRYDDKCLHAALKDHDASFIDSNKPKRSKKWREGSKVQKCWIFKYSATGMQLNDFSSDSEAQKSKKAENNKGNTSIKSNAVSWAGEEDDFE